MLVLHRNPITCKKYLDININRLSYIISSILLNMHQTCYISMITNVISKYQIEWYYSHITNQGIENCNESGFFLYKSTYSDFQKTIWNWNWEWWTMIIQSNDENRYFGKHYISKNGLLFSCWNRLLSSIPSDNSSLQ